MYPNPGSVDDVPSGVTPEFETYYSLLGISPDATPQEIRTAYMRRALETHPDRHAGSSTATATFQHIADAYQTLSDPQERAAYDDLLRERMQNPQNSPSWDAEPADATDTFANVFQELLRPEVESSLPIYQGLGTASGAALGFIIFNIPGLIAGSVAGNFLGLIRDRKGRSVYDVFMSLDGAKRLEILTKLAKTVLMSTAAQAFTEDGKR